MAIVAGFPEYRRTPIILGESDPEGCAACSSARHPSNAYRNGPLYGVSVAEATARSYELADRRQSNLQGAVTWAFEFEDQPYFAGFRDLATNGIDKAVLNVFRMWGALGGDWLKTSSDGALPLDSILASGVSQAPDVNGVATRQGREVDVLVWNYHDADIPAEAADVRLQIRGLTAHQVGVHAYRMDAEHSNSYGAWLRMGSPQPPDEQQLNILQRGSKLAEITDGHSQQLVDGTETIRFHLPRQAVELLKATW